MKKRYCYQLYDVDKGWGDTNYIHAISREEALKEAIDCSDSKYRYILVGEKKSTTIEEICKNHEHEQNLSDIIIQFLRSRAAAKFDISYLQSSIIGLEVIELEQNLQNVVIKWLNDYDYFPNAFKMVNKIIHENPKWVESSESVFVDAQS